MAKKVTRKRAPKKASAAKSSKREAQQPVIDLPTIDTTLDELIGQPRAVAVLRDAIEAQRVHHAWIFTGPSGVGKRTAALAFARELLLPGDDDLHHAEIDAQLRRGVYPDLHTISASLARVSRKNEVRLRKQTTLPREVVAEFLVEPALRTRTVDAPSVAAKVFIVEDAHLMGDAAQNLLLKTLEEPPAGTVIVLVTQSEDRMLATIRSRCQRVTFGTLSKPEMEPFADRLAPDLDDTERFIALALAAGSPGGLVQVVAGGMVAWAQELEQLFRAAEAGDAVPELGPRMTDLVKAEATRQVGKDKLASKEAANRRAASDMLRLVAERHRRQLRRQSTDAPASARYASAIEAVHQTERMLASNVPLQHAFGLLAAELCSVR